MRELKRVVPTVVALFCLSAGVAMAGTLDDVKAKGFVQAGYGRKEKAPRWKNKNR